METNLLFCKVWIPMGRIKPGQLGDIRDHEAGGEESEPFSEGEGRHIRRNRPSIYDHIVDMIGPSCLAVT